MNKSEGNKDGYKLIFKKVANWTEDIIPTEQIIVDYFKDEFVDFLNENTDIIGKINGEDIFTDIYYEGDRIGIEIYKKLN